MIFRREEGSLDEASSPRVAIASGPRSVEGESSPAGAWQELSPAGFKALERSLWVPVPGASGGSPLRSLASQEEFVFPDLRAFFENIPGGLDSVRFLEGDRPAVHVNRVG